MHVKGKNACEFVCFGGQSFHDDVDISRQRRYGVSRGRSHATRRQAKV